MEDESGKTGAETRKEVNGIVRSKKAALTCATTYAEMSPEERRSKIEFAEGMARINAIALDYMKGADDKIPPFTLNDIRLAVGWPIKEGALFGDVMAAPQEAFKDSKYDRRIPDPESESDSP